MHAWHAARAHGALDLFLSHLTAPPPSSPLSLLPPLPKGNRGERASPALARPRIRGVRARSEENRSYSPVRSRRGRAQWTPGRRVPPVPMAACGALTWSAALGPTALSSQRQGKEGRGGLVVVVCDRDSAPGGKQLGGNRCFLPGLQGLGELGGDQRRESL